MTEFVIISKHELIALIRNTVVDALKSDSRAVNEVSANDRVNQKQAAEFLGITQSTLIRWKKLGMVPFEQLEGSTKVFFYKSQLKHVIQQNPKLLQASRT
jgi:hypothetical protein